MADQQTHEYKPRMRDMLLLAAMRPDKLVAIGWWRLLGKRLRAKYRLRDAVAALPFAYERRIEAEGQADLAALAECDAAPRSFCIHVHVSASDQGLAEQAVTSALRQSYKASCQLIVTSDGRARLSGQQLLSADCANAMEGLRKALEHAQQEGVDYCIPLRADCTLPRHALATYARHSMALAGKGTDLPLLYADQDEGTASARSTNPWLKPAWDARMILSQDYVSAACAIPVKAALACLQEKRDSAPQTLFALLLQIAVGKSPLEVQHVPRIAVRTAAGDWQAHGEATVQALAAMLGDQAEVQPGPFGSAQASWPLPDPLPRISVVVATRDKVELLRTCVDGLLHDTDYPALEVIIADNDSQEPETLAYMDAVSTDPRVQVVRWPHQFNYSAINNFAASHATGEFLCLLNNDIEILHADWLTEMLREAARPGVGAVGARLLYPDRSIQHAGVVIGMGNAAGHAHRGLPEGAPGYFAQALIARGASAVTAACLLMRKSDFDAVGGLDEDNLAVAYNDVDLCLKLHERGLANVYTPAATLIHHESKSRGLDFAPEHMERYLRELAVFQKRWKTDEVTDPWHHRQMDRAQETYTAQNIS